MESLDAFKDIFLEQAEEYGYDKGMVGEVLKVTDVWRQDEECGRQVNRTQHFKTLTLPNIVG